jgi:hypothetical protein
MAALLFVQLLYRFPVFCRGRLLLNYASISSSKGVSKYISMSKQKCKIGVGVKGIQQVAKCFRSFHTL